MSYLLAAALLAQDNLDDTLRALEKEIAAVRGLEFTSPVKAKTIERPEGTAKGLQGYYSTEEKTLFVYDDLSGAYERGVLIHEMAHALQDQHFGLGKLHATTFGNDAETALSALIEGDATLTMIEMLKESQPKAGAMLDVPLEKAKNLRNSFLYAQGARYVRALKEKGGWEAVNKAYANPPRSTAAILHPEGVKSITLGPGPVKGEFGILAMFHADPETAPLAVAAAEGWRGDRTVERGTARAWVVATATERDAAEFGDAVAKLRAKDADLTSIMDEPAQKAWRSRKGAVAAILTRGARVYVVDAPKFKALEGLLDALEGATPALRVYDARAKEFITFGQLIDRLLAADVVCVGESHDSEPHHHVQHLVVKALHACNESLGVGLEMFQRPFQEGLDGYVAGELDEAEMLKATEYGKRWGFDWGLYRPIAEFCRRNGLPMAALNAPRELTQKISKEGYEGLDEEGKASLGDVDFNVKEHRDHWFEKLGAMHGARKPTPEQQERSYQVMTVWDHVMGTTAAEFRTERGLRRLVVLAGSGHVNLGIGIPARAALRGAKVATVHVEVGVDSEKPPAEPQADFTVYVP